jgi:hypothetical protein
VTSVTARFLNSNYDPLGFPKPSEQTFVSQVIDMTGSCWRLLVCSSLFLLAPIFLASALHAQGAVGYRSGALAPTLAIPSDPPSLSRPVRLPVPIEGPWREPVDPGPVGLPQIARSAGIIFSGRVTFVGRADASVNLADSQIALSPGQTASTMITFQVEQAVRGAKVGQSLTIREWAGLWAGKDKERYRVGERVFLFLYSPSRLGLTSPVAGPVGRFTIDPRGRIAMNAQNALALAGEPVIGGKKLIPYADFFHAVRRATGEE